jgi:hypothetical protein
MFKSIKDAVGSIILKQAEKVIARTYVRQCEKLADGDEMKLQDYMKPSMDPICLWSSVEKINDKGQVELGDFVVIVNEFQEHWILAFDDYVHAKEMADLYTEMTKEPVLIHPTSAICIFTQEAPVMGAQCCKTDGAVIETPKSVYRTLYRHFLKRQRKIELQKRLAQQKEESK